MTRPLSLTARLTLLFGLISAAILMGLGWVISAAIERHFAAEDMDELEGKILLVRNMLEGHHSTSTLAAIEQQLSDAFVGHGNLTMEITTTRGDVLFATSNLRFPRDHVQETVTRQAPTNFEWSEAERSFRGLAAIVHPTVPDADAVIVAVALDIGHHQQFIKQFNRTLSLYVAVAALLSAMLGRWAVRRGLAPLQLLKSHAATVTASRLDHHLSLDAVPAEMADLAMELNRMLTRLEDAFKRLSDFSSDLAHELRTPINNLMTQTHVALSRPRDAAGYLEILSSNAEEFERLARMISDMLFLAKADHGLVLPSREPIILHEEVDHIFDFYEALASELNIRLESSGDGCLIGDRLMLRRALSNLVSNALRHTSSGHCVSVCIEQGTNEVSVTVENPGKTVADEDLPHLFERFYRADRARTHHATEGSGLGLALVRAIAAAHNGSVSVESRDGLTRFSLRFPVSG